MTETNSYYMNERPLLQAELTSPRIPEVSVMTQSANAQITKLTKEAERLASSLRLNALAAELTTMQSAATVAELRDSGLLRLHQPAAFGGLELNHQVAAPVVDALTAATGSLAWFQSLMATHAWVLGCFPEKAQEAVWGEDRDALISTAFAAKPGNVIARDIAGYRIAGAWDLSSGCHHAQWLIVNGIPEGGEPPGLALLIPMTDVEITGSWKPTGLRGTGSYAVLVRDSVVPFERTMGMLELRGRASVADSRTGRPALYDTSFSAVFPYCVAIVGMSQAKYALRTSRELLSARADKRASLPVQLRYARADALVNAGAALMDGIEQLIVTTELGGTPLTTEDRVRIKRDASFALELGSCAIEFISPSLGAHSLQADSDFDRARRDLHAIRSHAAMSVDAGAEQFGRVAFGLSPTDPMQL